MPTRKFRSAIEIMGSDCGHREAVRRELTKLCTPRRVNPRQLREAKGLIQAEHAHKVGTTQLDIARLEAAAYTNLKLATLLKITSAIQALDQDSLLCSGPL